MAMNFKEKYLKKQLNYSVHFSIIEIVIIGGLAMEGTVELIRNNNESINEFLGRLITEKAERQKDVVGNINGFLVSVAFSHWYLSVSISLNRRFTIKR